MPLVFGTPTQIPQPPISRQGRWGNQSPFDPRRYWLHKDEWNTGSNLNSTIYFQERDRDGNWLTEETVFASNQTFRPEAVMQVDSAGRAMIVYRDRAAAPDELLTAWRSPATGIWTYELLQDATYVISGVMDLQARPGGGFVAVCTVSGSGEAETDPHVHLWEWSPATESWGSRIELPALKPDPGSILSLGVNLGINHVDGLYHLVGSFSFGGPAQFKQYHLIRDPVAGTNTAWTIIRNVGFPLHQHDPVIEGSQVNFGMAHLVWTRDNPNDPTQSAVQYLRYAGGVWSSPELVSASSSLAAAQGNMIVDVNDDVYVCFTEYDGTDMAVYVRRRLAASGTWEDPVKVATSTLSTALGWDYSTQSDPYWPGFIRPQVGRPIDTLALVWGSRFNATQPELWISEAIVRTETELEFGPGGGYIFNNNVRVFDGTVGGPWLKWRGKDV